jgi:hypothetical protein
MKNINLRGLLSAICIASVLACFTRIDAAPVRFDQVVQILNARPGSADTSTISRLRLTDDFKFVMTDDSDDDKKVKPPVPQDGRVITETKTEIVTDDVCDCEEEVVTTRGFPKWALLGLAAIPIAFILIKRKKDTPTPTPPTTPTPGITPSPTPPTTPTPTPGITPTPTPPPVTPTPTPPEPVPEPMTILLFGTGLASIGLAARRKFGKKGEKGEEKEAE